MFTYQAPDRSQEKTQDHSCRHHRHGNFHSSGFYHFLKIKELNRPEQQVKVNSKAEQTCKCPEELVWYSLDKRKKYLDIEMFKFLFSQGNTQEYDPHPWD